MPKKPPLYPHVPKSRKPSKLSRNDVEVYMSLPPFKASIWVENKETGETVWQLEGAESINRFGWKDQNRDQLEESVLKHLEDIGVLSASSSEQAKSKSQYGDIEIERSHGIIVRVGGINTKTPMLPDWDISYVQYPPGQMKEYRDAFLKARVSIVKVTDMRIYFEEK